MDTPNSGFGLIHKFPIDILAGIVLFVPGEDLARLMMTGSKSLWSILTCPNIVKSVNLGEDGLRFKSWPSFINEFPSLESLRIKNRYRLWWPGLGLTINQLPSSLRNLSLIIGDAGTPCDWCCDRLFEIPTSSDTIHLDEHLPHLEALEIMDNRGSNLDWVSYCPPSLTSLNVYLWKPDITLPSSLIHFKSVLGMPTAFPLSMESLSCARYSHSLPALTSLSASLRKAELAQLEDIVSLPISLTNLHTRNTLPSATWSHLPVNLQSLSFYADNDCTALSRIVDPVTGEVHQVETCPLELLPKSLTNIHINGEYGCSLFVSGCCPELFPPHLKFFNARYLRLAPNAAKQLPSSLTHLSTYNFYEQLCEHLPQGLTLLSFRNAILSPKTIQCLPKSLTQLNWSISSYRRGRKDWFDYTTGELILPSSLPEHTAHKDYATSFGCLPRSITSLELQDFRELQEDFIQNQYFPNLLSLTLSEMDQLTDNSIPLLNRHLTRLDVQASPNITGKSFKSLPQSLTHLRLAHSSIFDEDIQHLPRMLKDIQLQFATELTDACIRSFPRGCERLSLWKNTRITQLFIPDFPLAMNHFLASWIWTRPEM